MSYALLCHTAKGSGDGGYGVTTDALDTSGCDLLVVSVSTYDLSAGRAPLTDSKGNTWTALTLRDQPSMTGVRLYYCQNPTVGSWHTFTAELAGQSYPTVCVSGWSGSKTSPFDVENGSNTAQPGSITPAEDNELLIAALGFYPEGTISIDSSFTISDQINYVINSAMGACLAYQVQTTATARNPQFSHSTGFTQKATAIAAFKAAAASGQPAMRRYGRLRPLEIGREGVLIY